MDLFHQVFDLECFDIRFFLTSRFSVCDLSSYLLISFAAEWFCFAEIQLLYVYSLSESIGTGVAALDFMKNRGL